MVVTSVAKDDLGRGVARALRDIVQGEPPEATARVVICALRSNTYTLAQFLEECASAKDEALRQIGSTDRILEAWRRIDHVVATALRETSRIHETVLKTCARGYAELDREGP